MKSRPADPSCSEEQPGHLVLVALAPDRFGLRLHATHGAQHGARAVKNAQAALHLDGEVDVSGVSMMLIRCSG